MRLNRGLLLVTGLALSASIVVVFQNCAPKGFKVIAAGESISQSSVTPPPSVNSVITTNFEIPNTPPSTLSASGFLAKMENKSFVNFQEYAPQYPLYSDGATKRRFIYLPQGEKIDTSDPDEWRYPRGTIFWKEFSIDGKRVETRVWEKFAQGTGLSAWRSSLYVWRADQSEADLMTTDFYTKPMSERQLYQAGLIEAKYKLISPAACVKCHQSGVETPLGFNYLELSKKDLKVNIYSLAGQSLLTIPLLVEDQIRGSQKARDAMGYMQTNCATCHNGITQARNFRHSSKTATYADENIVKEIAIASSNNPMPLITFGDLTNSRIYQRVLAREMPQIAPIVADPNGLNILSAWIMENSPGSSQ